MSPVFFDMDTFFTFKTHLPWYVAYEAYNETAVPRLTISVKAFMKGNSHSLTCQTLGYHRGILILTFCFLLPILVLLATL